MNIKLSHLSSADHKTRHTGYHAIKLNRLKDKQAQYDSYESFLTKCIEAEIVPTGVVVDIEPKVSNHSIQQKHDHKNKENQHNGETNLLTNKK